MKSLLRPLFRKLYYLLYGKKGKVIRINGRNYRVSAHNARGIPAIIDEPPYNALKGFCKDANIVFDIGASNGIISLLLAKEMKPGSVIYSFEPTPSTFEYLKDTARVQDGSANIKPYKLAISDKEGHVYFEHGRSYTKNKIVASPKTNTLRVDSTTIDIFCRQNNVKPEVIKIDVEGAEYLVLQGMLNTLKNNDCIILMEIHQTALKDNGVTEVMFNKLIKQTGYFTYNLKGEPCNNPFGVDWVLILSKKELNF